VTIRIKEGLQRLQDSVLWWGRKKLNVGTKQ